MSIERWRSPEYVPANPSLILFPYGITETQANNFEEMIVERWHDKSTSAVLLTIIDEVCHTIGLIYTYPLVDRTIYL